MIERAEPHGVLIVDKPRGPTSHDVVAWTRRALGTRGVGHAGTLDPMATGVLVVAVGEATKLVRWLTVDDKAYRATIELGAETDTLDAEGRVVETAPVPEALDARRVSEVAAGFLGTTLQRAPVFSAIKVGGQALHARARRGEVVEAPEREVLLCDVRVIDVEGARVELELEVGKGFYVRAFARDLARELGTRGHLSGLRRTRSGPFGIAGALEGDVLARAAAGDADARGEVRSRLLDLSRACVGMPRVTLEARGVEHARHGRPIDRALGAGADVLGLEVEPVALLDDAGALVAVAALRGDRFQVLRGLKSA
jgi:tRNA pseudouridine55 synthase